MIGNKNGLSGENIGSRWDQAELDQGLSSGIQFKTIKHER